MGLERMLVFKYATKTHIDPRLVAVIQKLVGETNGFIVKYLKNVKFLFPPKNTSKRLFSMLISHAISSKPEFREDVLRQLTYALELVSGGIDNTHKYRIPAILHFGETCTPNLSHTPTICCC